MDKSKLLMIAMGRGPKGPPPAADDAGDDGPPDDGGEQDDETPTATDAADDLIDALHAKDARGVVEAFRALSETCAGDQNDSGE